MYFSYCLDYLWRGYETAKTGHFWKEELVAGELLGGDKRFLYHVSTLLTVFIFSLYKKII
jgi:hypothetical protein